MSPLALVLLVVIFIVLLGGFAGGVGPYQWGPGYGFGHAGLGGIGTVLIILLILALLGYL
jgi:hypothetical protein